MKIILVCRSAAVGVLYCYTFKTVFGKNLRIENLMKNIKMENEAWQLNDYLSLKMVEENIIIANKMEMKN